MAGAGIEIEFIDAFQIGDSLPGLVTERMAAVKSVQHDALEQIAEPHIVIFSQPFQDLEQAFLQTNPRLDPFNQNSFARRRRCAGCLRQCALLFMSFFILVWLSKVIEIKEVLFLCRGLQSRKAEMFIELRNHPDLTSSGGAKIWAMRHIALLRS